MAQPSVSMHVHALEAQAGGNLFERRRGRGVSLTELGQTFLHHARQLLAEADEMEAGLSRSRAQAARRVRFGCQRSLSYVLPTLLAEFASQHPEVEFVTRVGRQEEIIDLTRNGAVDLGLFLGNEVPGLRSTVIGRQRLAIVASPDHPLAHRLNIPPADLAAYPFVGAPDGSLFGQSIAQILEGIGAQGIRVVSKATEFEFLRALVLAGVGLYCCVLDRVSADVKRGELVVLSLAAPPLTMEVRQVVSPRKPISPSVALVAEFLRRRVAAAGQADSICPIS